MKLIATPDEPACLAAWRADNPEGTWEAFRQANRDSSAGTRGCSTEVRDALSEAQHGLCAFCEIDLREPLALWSQVEHWHPKDPKRYPEHNWGLDFTNMMAGCEGGERHQPETERSLPPIAETRHCGPAKANDDYTTILLDPRKNVPATPPTWSFNARGEMSVNKNADPSVAFRAEQTIKLLNLDSRVLRRLRSKLWAELGNDVQRVWEEFGGSEEDFLNAYDRVAEERLALQGNKLNRFWSTMRCYFGAAAETWLADHPEVFA